MGNSWSTGSSENGIAAVAACEKEVLRYAAFVLDLRLCAFVDSLLLRPDHTITGSTRSFFHSPRVKSGNRCGAFPCLIERPLNSVTALIIAPS